MQQRYNAIIIGFGKGGKTLAAYLADQGQSVAIVERSDKMYGGTCINYACIPPPLSFWTIPFLIFREPKS